MKLQTLLYGLLLQVSLIAHAVPQVGHKMLISGPSPYAAAVGQEIAQRGGNIVDVAVAVGLTIAVTNPYYGALGGGGFALVKMRGRKPLALDFREVAPKATHPKFYIDKVADASRNGGNAIGTPGIPAGYYELHKKYGRIAWEELLRAPISLAKNGFRVTGDWVKFTNQNKTRFNKSALRTFFKKGKYSYKPGQIFKQPRLAKALQLLQSKKFNGFYKGAVAKDIVKAVTQSGGVLSLDDLANYKVRWMAPLTTKFKGHKIHLMPPPSSGGVVIQSALSLIEKTKLEGQPFLSINETHMISEILSRSYRGRALLGDPDFHKNPFDKILSKNYLTEMASSIDITKTRELEPLADRLSPESNETTNFSILDAQGNGIAVTVTLNGRYGSGVVSSKYGIALNNEMDDFTTIPGKPNMFGLIQGKGNQVQPGKRPLSSMSPTLVEKKGKVVLAIGAPGGPRIISSVIQVIYRVLVTGLNMDEAIRAPRVHHQFLPRKLYVDAKMWAPETLKGLRAKGHDVEESWVGRVFAVRRRADNLLEAAYDSRGEGATAGF